MREVAQNGYKSGRYVLKNLGNSYYFNSEFAAAANGYGELCAMNQRSRT